jgi:MarR family transcriptional regulator, organic hydroperoxide resistance regulator
MNKDTLPQQAERMMLVIHKIIRFKFNKRFGPPEEVEKLKQLMEKRRGADAKRVHEDLELFFRISSLLVDRKEAYAMGELSSALDVPLSTTTRMVDWQVSHGFIERLADANDRRIVRVTLTQTGKELYRNATAMIKKQIGEILREFPAPERKQFVALMERLGVILEALAR